MAQSSREAVFAALFALLKPMTLPTVGAFALTGRRLLIWDNVPPASQPAMFMKQGQQTATSPNLALTQWILTAAIWIYWRVEGAAFDQDSYPDKFINDALDLIEKTIDPRPGERQTLGGLVYQCKLDGSVVFDDGLEDSQGVLVVPISILVGI